MKITFLSLLLSVTNIYGLDSDAIKKIAEEPHSRENLMSELKIYPDGREFKINNHTGKSFDELKAEPELIITQKIVRGRYIVSRLILPEVKKDIIMIVTFDKDTGTFKKWVLLANGTVSNLTGIADFGTRTIAWSTNKPYGDTLTTVLGIETHSDNNCIWKEVYLHDGEVFLVGRGESVKVK